MCETCSFFSEFPLKPAAATLLLQQLHKQQQQQSQRNIARRVKQFVALRRTGNIVVATSLAVLAALSSCDSVASAAQAEQFSSDFLCVRFVLTVKLNP